MLFSIMNLVYTASSHPFQSKLGNRIEVYNELTIYINQQLFTTLLNSGIPWEIRSKYAWAMMLLSFVNIFISLGVLMTT